ncbi:CRISPR-associated endoribonuclease Cas6 [Tepidimonas charontis]|uniref:CRISPR-associated endoribonuclease Cas6 n=2 Tax=Tepidimonas charontis TaxID=2267262 RepID=A0A554XFQ7_9BURK|nr:CRISPR-associated endoribonuclease Cas6 [Tepidimonas charontis]
MGEFPGSAWRGALGHALKRTACVTRLPQCRPCALYQSCVYPYFYDTPPPPTAQKMRRYETTPHPFILEPGTAGGCSYQLGFKLIGVANRQLAVFIHALSQAAQGPKGVAGNRLQLEAVEQETYPGSGHWRCIYRPQEALQALPQVVPLTPEAPGDLRIELLTPLRVKRDGRHVGPREFRFADLFGTLLRRISMLSFFHTDTPLETDFKGLMAQARAIEAVTALNWEDKLRYSSRQQVAMKLGGVIGHIEIRGQDLRPFWRYLWLGQWLHVGSGATMGLGQYRVEGASLPALHDAGCQA